MIEKFAGSDSPSTTSSTSAPSSSTSTGSDAVEFYLELLQVSSKLEATQCHELKKWAMSVKNHGNTILKLKLTRYIVYPYLTCMVDRIRRRVNL